MACKSERGPRAIRSTAKASWAANRSPHEAAIDEENDITLIWQKISKSITDIFNERFDKFEEKFQCLLTAHQALTEMVNEVENQTTDYEQRIQHMEATLAAVHQENKVLRYRLLDLEARSRHNNIKIVGIPEDEENGSPTDFVFHLIPHFDMAVVIDRAHHKLQPKPVVGSKPRTITAWVHLAQEKLRILRLMRQCLLEYCGKRSYIFPDYTMEVMEQQQGFKDVLREKKNIKHPLHFPARLQVHHEGQVQQPRGCQKLYRQRTLVNGWSLRC